VVEKHRLEYSQAHSKNEKSSIISDVLDIVRGGCPDGRGALIRNEKNRWIELSELDARDKISSVMRNVLHKEYKSSAKSRMAKRKYEHDKALKVGIQIEAGRPRSLEKKASSVDLCSKYDPADDTTNKHADEVVDLLGGEDFCMERFFEHQKKASSVDLCSKYDPADNTTNKHEDEVVDLLGGEAFCMERFFEHPLVLPVPNIIFPL
jgi:hypothetical protein